MIILKGVRKWRQFGLTPWIKNGTFDWKTYHIHFLEGEATWYCDAVIGDFSTPEPDR